MTPSTTSSPSSTPTDPSSDDAGAAATGTVRRGPRAGSASASGTTSRTPACSSRPCRTARGARSRGQPSNERLEFLGDAVLGLVVAEHSYRAYPDLPEGPLAKVRAAVVNTAVLAEVAHELELGDALLLGPGRGRVGRPDQGVDPGQRRGGRDRGGVPRRRLERGAGLVLRLLDDASRRPRRPGRAMTRPAAGARLHRGAGQPRYEVEGPGPTMPAATAARVLVAGSDTGRGRSSKKDAEQAAARQAFEALQSGQGSRGERRRAPAVPVATDCTMGGAVPELPEVETHPAGPRPRGRGPADQDRRGEREASVRRHKSRGSSGPGSRATSRSRQPRSASTCCSGSTATTSSWSTWA